MAANAGLALGWGFAFGGGGGGGVAIAVVGGGVAILYVWWMFVMVGCRDLLEAAMVASLVGIFFYQE